MGKTGAIFGLIFSIIALIVVVCLFAVFMKTDSIGDLKLGYQNYSYDDARKYSAGDASLDAKDVHTIKIDWVDGSVKLNAYGGEKLEISESFSGEAENDYIMRYRLKDGVLSIKFCRSGLVFGASEIPQKQLTVNVPVALAKELQNIEAITTSAHITISEIGADEIDLESVSGNIVCNHSSAKRLDLETVSGDVDIMGEYGELSFEGVSGNMELNGKVTDIELENVSGDMRLELREAPENLELSAVSGDTVIYIPESSSFGGKYEVVSGDFICEIPGKISKNSFDCGRSSGFSLESVSGNIEIRVLPENTEETK